MKQDCFSLAPPIIKEFLGYMGTVKGKSPLTVEEYFMDLRTFFRYMQAAPQSGTAGYTV